MDESPVFKALADPTRRRLLDVLHEQPASTLADLCNGLDMRRQSVSQHLEVLEEASLVVSVRDGRRKLHFLNPVPVREIQRRWIWKFEEPHLDSLEEIKKRAEEHAMTESPKTTGPVPDYVYTTYISASADDVWCALTDARMTSRFWGHAQVSEWTVGSTVEHVRTDGSGIVDAAGQVMEVDRPHRLVFGFADSEVIDDPTREQSIVTFEITSHEDIVKLTLTHTRLASPEDLRRVGHGWPSVIANLKTLLETGDVLPQAPWELPADEHPVR